MPRVNGRPLSEATEWPLPGVHPPVWPGVVLSALLVLAVFLPAGALTVVDSVVIFLGLVVFVALKKHVDTVPVKAVLPYLGILVIGLIAGADKNPYDYLKDAWYVVNPAITLATGYFLYVARPDVTFGLRAFLLSAVLVSLWRLAALALNPELVLLPVPVMREIFGTGNYAPALGAAILFAYGGVWAKELKLSPLLAGICLVICLGAVVLSFSRTMLITALFSLLIALGMLSRREIIRVGCVAAIAVMSIAGVRMVAEVDSNGAQESFLSKLAHSTNELGVEEYAEVKDINLNWRGYETARAIRTYSQGSLVELIFGQGFGTSVDLGLFMPLGTREAGERVQMRFAPILHNGYAYLLVKGGPVAVFLFCWSLLVLYFSGREKAGVAFSADVRAPARLMQAIVATLAFSTWVIAGVFNKVDMFPFLLAGGYLAGALPATHHGRA